MILKEDPGKNYSSDWWGEKARQLLEDQKVSWVLLKNNYENLENVQTRAFEFGCFEVKVQFNHGRVASTSADVAEETIKNRKCFLCSENLPKEQNALLYKYDFLILANPFPIFKEHFTISKKEHSPQRIADHFETMLDICKDLQKHYTIFYNGAACGASAPDHMHFQAVTKFEIPLEQEFEAAKKNFKTGFFKMNDVEISFVDDLLRRFISIESNNKTPLLNALNLFFTLLKAVVSTNDEPMINIICSYVENSWRIFLFPRRAHRPKQFFAADKNKLLISPAAVDMGGLFIAPREKDFKKITPEDVVDIFKQVTITKEYFEFLRKKMGEIFI